MSQPRDAHSNRTGAAQDPPGKVGDRAHPHVYFDVTDLLFYLRWNKAVSGIQRVQCELIRNLDGMTRGAGLHFTVFGEAGLDVVAMTDLFGIIDGIRAGPASFPHPRDRIRALLAKAVPAKMQAGDLFLTTGAFWAVDSVGRRIRQLKNLGMTIGVFVHDILPISRPEFFKPNNGHEHVKPLVEVLALADFAATSSNYNRKTLLAYRANRGLASIPIDIVPFGHGLPKPSNEAFEPAAPVAALVESTFVLCVGTIEVRKNLPYLLNIWRLMVEADRPAIPTLVLVGRKGWLVDDLLGQLDASGNLDGRIAILHDVPDEALDLLYRRCLLTIFPSFDEGWGLPVGESLTYGKICLASKAGGVPEVGGASADYIDPYNVRDGYGQLVRYLDEPDLRTSREAEIARQFPLRSWQGHAAGIMLSIRANMANSPKASGPAAVSLPANAFLPIGSQMEGSSRQAVLGHLSADSACVSGWSVLQPDGIAAAGPTSVLQFRAAHAPRATVTLILRLSASGPGPCEIRIRPISGAERRVAIEPGPDRMTTLSCESDPDGLVTIFLDTLDDPRSASADFSSWALKGFLYIQPSVLAAAASDPAVVQRGAEAKEMAMSAQAADRPPGYIKAAPPSARSRNVNSLAEFLRVPNSTWHSASGVTFYRREPIFADPADRQLFLTRYRNFRSARVGAVRDDIALRRLGDQYVSLSRWTEGAIFDSSGVPKDGGYFEAAQEDAPWLTRTPAGIRIHAEALAKAPHLEGTFAIFFNGNLQNYYHWVAEGLLALDVLTQTIGEGLDLKLVLPRTMDVNAALDHRASLEALGFDRWPVVEAPPPLARVGEAVWLESGDVMEDIPAAHVKRFQRRIAARYAERRGSRNRRLLVKRLGPTRTMSNFDQIEAFLRPRGFETVWLEGMSIQEQILLFQRAEFVVGVHGAGLTNLLFCEAGTRVIEFMPSVEMRPFFWLIAEKLGLRHAMQFCPGVEGEGFQASLHVDIDRLRLLYGLLDGDG